MPIASEFSMLGAEIGQRVVLADELKEVWTVSKIA
jgi:hypothetical protein